MIVTTLMGGFGNQLFQYAAGRALALRTDRRLVLDATRLPAPANGMLRPLVLPALPIPALPILRRPGRRGTTTAPSRAADRVQRVASIALRRSRIVEPMDRDVLVDLSTPPRPLTVLFGYWQSHRYFDGFEATLRSELMPEAPAGGRVASALAAAGTDDTILLHVRRGDYVTDPSIARSHGAQPEGYFRAAAEIVAERCERPVFLVLSDDPRWVAEHLHLDAPCHHVELETPLDAVEALGLMARTRHAVISNSTLSWWGAWLAQHPGQQVIAPARWIASREIDPAHRFPPGWRTL